MKSVLLCLLSVLSIVQSQVPPGLLYVHADNTIFIACECIQESIEPECRLIFVEPGPNTRPCIKTTIYEPSQERRFLVTEGWGLGSYRGKLALSGGDGSLRFRPRMQSVWKKMAIQKVAIKDLLKQIGMDIEIMGFKYLLKHNGAPVQTGLEAYNRPGQGKGYMSIGPPLAQLYFHPINSDGSYSMPVPLNVAAPTHSSIAPFVVPPTERALTTLDLWPPQEPVLATPELWPPE